MSTDSLIGALELMYALIDMGFDDAVEDEIMQKVEIELRSRGIDPGEIDFY